MGRTVPSFRMALDFEIELWKGFRKALPTEHDRQAFGTLMDICRNHSSAAGCATSPIIFEPMVMSMLLERDLGIRQIEEQLQDILWREVCIKIQPGTFEKSASHVKT